MARDDSSDAGWSGDGGVNGSSSNGGGSGGKGDGWTTTTDPGGWTIGHYGDSESPSGNINGGGGSGGGQGSFAAATTIAMGVAQSLSLTGREWGFAVRPVTVLPEIVQQTLTKLNNFKAPSLARLATSMTGRFGLFAGLLTKSSSLNLGEPNMVSEKDLYGLVVFSAETVTSTPLGQIKSMAEVPVNFQVTSAIITAPENIHYGVPKSVITTAVQYFGFEMPAEPNKKEMVSVVQAKPTKHKDVYTAQVVPGKPDISISIVKDGIFSVPSVPKDTVNMVDFVAPITSTEKVEKHNAIVSFPDGSGHAPIYVSVSKLLTEAERKALAEKARKEREAWEKAHPVEAAELKVDAALKAIVTQQQNLAATKNTQYGRLLLDPVKNPVVYTRPYRRIVIGAFDYQLSPKAITVNSAYVVQRLLNDDANAYVGAATNEYEVINRRYLVEDYNHIRNQLLASQATIKNAQSLVSNAEKSHAQEDAKLKHLLAQIEAEKARELAKIAAEKARLEAEFLEKKLEEERKAQAVAIKSLQNKIADSLSKPNVFSIYGIGEGLGYGTREVIAQISIKGKGAIALNNGAELVEEQGFQLEQYYHSPGEHADQFGGLEQIELKQDKPDILAYSISLNTLFNPSILPQKGDDSDFANIAVRGNFEYQAERTILSLAFHGQESLLQVPILKATLDQSTGLYQVILPGQFGTILITPLNPPTTNTPPLGIPIPRITFPQHTGITVENINIDPEFINVMPEDMTFHDYVLVFPDNSGLKPIYVMLSDPLDSEKFTRKQLDKKFKHAIDFGITDTKKNSETLTKFRDAIDAHLVDINTVERGIYRREKNSKVFYNPNTNNVIVLDEKGKFVSGWHLIPNSPQYESYINNGVL